MPQGLQLGQQQGPQGLGPNPQMLQQQMMMQQRQRQMQQQQQPMMNPQMRGQ
jgi:hypothetical protein